MIRSVSILGLVGVALLAGCSEDGHELLVELKTDLAPGVDFAEIRTELVAGRPTDLVSASDAHITMSNRSDPRLSGAARRANRAG